MADVIPLNPYVAGGALSDPGGRGFFGRDDIFEFVRSSLAAEQRTPILLFGQRRIGKSSILRQLVHRLAPEHACVFFDLQGKASMTLDQVLYGLGRALADTLQTTRPEREEATEERFVERVLNPAIASAGGSRRLVLLFDEFDVVDERLGGAGVAASRFIGFLGELVQREPNLGCILVVGRKTDELSEEFNATLLKNAVQKRIGRLDQRQTAALVREPARGRLEFTDRTVERVFELTGGHPFCTQILCNALWTHHVSEPAPFAVTPAHVEEAVPAAIELGTTGLNWIFDGLTSPAHRVFLSALAGQANPLGGVAVPAAAIEEALVARRIVVDRLELSRAPRELERWDVIAPSTDGYRFAVAMVGEWVRRERPLEQLERDVRFANPRAFSYYELAVDAHRRGDLDRAVSDYRGALEANSVFLEAQQGLAAALLQRRGPGDVTTAVEASERAFELDPEGARRALLEVLLEDLEETPALGRRLAAYRRLVELGPETVHVARARRFLRDRADRLLRLGYATAARAIFSAIDESDGATTALRKRRSTLFRVGFLSLTALLSLSPLLLFVDPYFGSIKRGVAELVVLSVILGTGGALAASAALQSILALTNEPEPERLSRSDVWLLTVLAGNAPVRWLSGVLSAFVVDLVLVLPNPSPPPIFVVLGVSAVVSGIVYWTLGRAWQRRRWREVMSAVKPVQPGDAAT